MVQWVLTDRVDLSKDAQRQQVGAPEALMLPGDNEAHRWEITVLNNGEVVDLTGASVAGYFLRSDGETVAVVGSVTGNVISVVLAQECYAFEGLMRAIVRVTLNGVITTVIQRLFRVQQDIGDQIIDPGEVIPDIDELLAQIAAMEAATDAAEAAAAAVPDMIAPIFSASTTYMAGDYVYYDGALYRFTADHAAGAWTGTDAAEAVLGQDVSGLKSAIEEIESLTIETVERTVTTDILSLLTWTSGYMATSGTTGTANNMQYSNSISVMPGDTIDVLPTAAEFRFVCAFNGDDVVSNKGAQNVNTYTVPDGVDSVIITVYVPTTSYAPSNIKHTTEITEKKDKYEDDIAELTTSVDAIEDAVIVEQYQKETKTDITPVFADGFMNTNGTVINTGSSAYFDHTQKILVQPGDVVSALHAGSASYDMRFVCAFTGDTVVSASGWDNSNATVAPYVVPTGIDGVVISVRDSYGIDAIRIIHNEAAKSAYVKPIPLGYMTEHDTLSDGESMFLPYHNVKNDNIYIFNANVDSFTKIRFAKENSFYIEVDSTNLYITNDTTTIATPHGITVADNIALMVCNETEASVSLVRVSSDGQEFNYTTATRFLMDAGTPEIQSTGSALTECAFSWVSKNVNAPIWLFGDSYFSWYESRWTYYLARDGYTKNCMLNGYAGEASQSAYNALVNLLKITTPKIVVWCLGMNDSDGETAVNANWERYYNRLINLSKKYGFEIVLYTVPTTPVINNKFKNAIIRNSGYRYIEADLAVRIDESGNWIPGALNEGTPENPDNVHPTVMGAKIIYHRVLADLPEIMCN